MNQENMTGNPTLDLLNQASGMNEFQAPMGDFNSAQAINIGSTPTGNPTLDLLNQSSVSEATTNIFGGNVINTVDSQSFGMEQQYTPIVGNPTLDLLNQSTVISTQTEMSDYNLDPIAQSDTQFTRFQPVENPMLQGQSQFVSIQPEVEQSLTQQPVITQELQAVAFGTPVNQPSFVQQSPEALFGGGNDDTSGSVPTSPQEFNPFDFSQ